MFTGGTIWLLTHGHVSPFCHVPGFPLATQCLTHRVVHVSLRHGLTAFSAQLGARIRRVAKANVPIQWGPFIGLPSMSIQGSFERINF